MLLIEITSIYLKKKGKFILEKMSGCMKKPPTKTNETAQKITEMTRISSNASVEVTPPRTIHLRWQFFKLLHTIIKQVKRYCFMFKNLHVSNFGLVCGINVRRI